MSLTAATVDFPNTQIDVPENGFIVGEITNTQDQLFDVSQQQKSGAGAAYNIGGTGDSSPYGSREEQKKQDNRNASVQAQIVAQIQQDLNDLADLMEKQAAAQKQLLDVRYEIKRLETENKQLTERNQEIEIAEAHVEQQIEALEQSEETQIQSFEMAAQDLVNAYRLISERAYEKASQSYEFARENVTVNHEFEGHDARRYAVMKDDQGAYYIHHPETGQPQYLLDLDPDTESKYSLTNKVKVLENAGLKVGTENDSVHKTAREKFDTNQSDLNEEVAKHGGQALKDMVREKAEIVEHSFIDLVDIQTKLVVAREELNKLRDEKNGNNRQIEENNAAIKGHQKTEAQLLDEIAGYKKEIADVFTRLGDQGVDVRNLNNYFAEMKQDGFDKARHEELMKNFEGDTALQNMLWKISNLAKEVEKQTKQIEELDEAIEEVNNHISEYIGREAQFKALYGGGSIKIKAAEILNKTADIINSITDLELEGPELTLERALDFAENNPDHPLTKAWEDVIQHDGQDVYRENETGKLYTLDENGNQAYITDQKELQRIRSEAFEKGRMFANESPHGKSKHDTFIETRDAIETAAARKEELAEDKKTLEDSKADTQADIEDMMKVISGETREIEKHCPPSISSQPDAKAGDLGKHAFAPAAKPLMDMPHKGPLWDTPESEALKEHKKLSGIQHEEPTEEVIVGGPGLGGTGNNT